MSHVIVGACPHCGAPLYSPAAWSGITPPPVQYSCDCYGQRTRWSNVASNATSATLPVFVPYRGALTRRDFEADE